MGDTTRIENKGSTRNKTEMLCHQGGLHDGCRDVLLHISESIDRIDTRMDRMEIKIAKGDPEMTTRIAVIDERVQSHGKILGAMGGLLAAQAIAIITQLLMQ